MLQLMFDARPTSESTPILARNKPFIYCKVGMICKVNQFASHLSTAVYGSLDSPAEQSNNFMGNVFLCSASLLLLLLFLLFNNIWVRMEISFMLRERWMCKKSWMHFMQPWLNQESFPALTTRPHSLHPQTSTPCFSQLLNCFVAYFGNMAVFVQLRMNMKVMGSLNADTSCVYFN